MWGRGCSQVCPGLLLPPRLTMLSPSWRADMQLGGDGLSRGGHCGLFLDVSVIAIRQKGWLVLRLRL